MMKLRFEVGTGELAPDSGISTECRPDLTGT
jgi:hypothetical protein